MKAITLSSRDSAEAFRVAELPMPSLRVGDVLIKVSAVSFNPIDYQLRKSYASGGAVPSPILGRDLSGVVVAVDSQVHDFSPGDEVYSYVCTLANSGTYAEYVAVPAELVAKKPHSLTHDEAAAVPVAATTAWLTLDKLGIAKTKSLFIAGGAGGVGTFAIMLARLRGVRRLITTAGSAASRDHLIAKCGVSGEDIVDYRESLVERALTQNGGTFNCVADLVGGGILSACCKLLAIDGQLASVTEAPSQDDFEHLFQKNASFHAIGANAYSLTDDRECWKTYRRILDALTQLFDSGALPRPPVRNVGSLSVETVGIGHGLLERSAAQGKLVMTV